MLCIQESGNCLQVQMRHIRRSLQDLKHIPASCPVPNRQSVATRTSQLRMLKHERIPSQRISAASTGSTYDSACCLAEEEEDEEPRARVPIRCPSSDKSLEFDSGYSEASWQDEGVVLRRKRNVRVPTSACLRTNRTPGGRIRPKSTSDACLERWTAFEASDTEDWTTSLLTRSRNRQPLVLGDNSFADLIGNWLDLPECPEQAELKPNAGRRLGRELLVNMRRKLAGMSKNFEGRGRSANRNSSASKRLSCPVGFRAQVPFFYQSHTGLHELETDFCQFTALMKTGSRQPFICNDIIGYI